MRNSLFLIRTIVLFLAFSTFYVSVSAQTIYYVNIATGVDTNPGTSWGGCFQNLTRAVAAAQASTDSEVQIWVAAGIYHPTDATGSPYNADTAFAFYRGSGVGRKFKIYGGFAGSESSILFRDSLHTTYLDGNLGSGTNSEHVVVINGLGTSADSVVVDGLTIRYGKANNGPNKNYNGYTVYSNSGGGIYMWGNTSTKILFNNCIVSQNQVNGLYSTSYSPIGAGAGIYANASNPVLVNCTITGNICSSLSTEYSSFIYGASAQGGGFYANSCSIDLENCTISANKALGSNADVFFTSYGYGVPGTGCGGGLYMSNSYADINNCTFLSNNAHGGQSSFSGVDGQGGGLFAASSTIYMNNTVFNSDTATGNYSEDVSGETASPGDGGGMYLSSTTCSLYGCTIEHNMAMTGNNDFYASSAAGGGMYNSTSTVNADSCFFSGNKNPTPYGSGSGGAIFNTGSTCTFTACSFTGNESGYFEGSSYGGAVSSSSTNANYVTCLFQSNSANIGGGCYNSSGSAKYSGCSFINNSAGEGYPNNGGGAISAISSTTTIDSCKFVTNVSSYEGGAVYSSGNDLFITRSFFSGNQASSSQGGGLYFTSPSGYLKGDGNIFYKNTAEQGGAVSVLLSGTGTDTLINNLFALNNVYGSSSSVGGALQLNTNQHFVCNNTFFHDSSSAIGGSIRCEGTYSSYTVANNIFYGSKGSGTSADTSLGATYGSYSFYDNVYKGTQPLFVDTTDLIGPDSIWATRDDGLQLRPCSPAVNAGGMGFVAADEFVDITGSVRTILSKVDIGAYQTNPATAIAPTYTTICTGSSVLLSDTTAGGVWSMTNPAFASVNASGVVSGLAQGNDTVTYVVNVLCPAYGDTMKGIAFAIVNIQNVAKPITGLSQVCLGNTLSYADSTTGGYWHSNNAGVLSITPAGVAVAIAAGTATVSYLDTNICGNSADSMLVTVQLPAAAIVGPDSICAGAAHIFSDSISGGAWSSVNTAIATIDSMGNVFPLSAGTDTLIYTVINSCGNTTASATLLVQRPASVLISPDTICAGTTVVLTDSTGNGVWTSGDTSVATAGITGSVTGVSQGLAIITYTVENACGVSATSENIVVQIPVSPVAGSGPLCVDSVILFTNVTQGGSWSSSNTSFATIDSFGLAEGIGPGNDSIYYSVTNVCGSSVAGTALMIERSASIISGGSDTICLRHTEALTDSVSGGVWSTDAPLIASINTSGVVSGLSAGLAEITYTINNSCGISQAVKFVYISNTGVCYSDVLVNNLSYANEITVYPDPVTDFLYIKSPVEINTTLLNIEGVKVSAQINASIIDIRHVPPGIYLLYIYNKSGVCEKVCRVIKN